MNMKKYLILLVSLLLLPSFVQAQESQIVVSPRIADEQSKAGDILKYDVVIKNESESKINIYALVNDISKTEGEEEFLNPADLNKETSVARWIKFKRGVIEIAAGEERRIPLEINIPSVATPGKRFARIAFPDGSNRKIAQEGMTNKSYTQLLINIEIQEEVIEKSQIKEFGTLDKVFLTSPGTFVLKLKNFGNKAIKPQGNIYIFNKRGEAVASLTVDTGSESIGPDELWEKNIVWEDLKGFGKFKAKLELEYGQKDKRDLQDTIFFWILPWKWLLGFFLGTFMFLVLMVTLIFKKTFQHQQHGELVEEEEDEEDNNNGVLNLKK